VPDKAGESGDERILYQRTMNPDGERYERVRMRKHALASDIPASQHSMSIFETHTHTLSLLARNRDWHALAYRRMIIIFVLMDSFMSEKR
jgi:hypothetical protein